MRLKHFKMSEFASPDLPESGRCMEHQLLERIDEARDIAGFPFIVTSGFRSVDHNKKVGGKTNSSHLLGWAVDIHCENSRYRFELIDALMEAGFTRLGIGQNYVHADCDPEKPNHLIWLY